MIQVIESEQAPAALVQLVRLETEDVPTIESVVFGAYFGHMKQGNTVATYLPDQKTIYIDLGNALLSVEYYNQGMMFIPNVWYTVIFGLYHEIEHASQLEAEPRLIEYNTLPQEYEDGANESARQGVEQWARENPISPPLAKLGWLGTQLIIMLNAVYTKNPDVSDEPDLHQFGAAASVDDIFTRWQFTDQGRRGLIDAIEAESFGLKVNGKHYLTASGFFGLERL